MDVKIIHYTPELHNSLLAYMQSVYPYRNVEYLNWWIANIDQSDEECWGKCTIILGDGQIIGCTTVNYSCIRIDSKEKRFFVIGNTIISPNQRGKGISKEIYKRVNLYDDWLSVGITDIAWKIQPRYVKQFTPIRPINVYISVNYHFIEGIIYKLLHKHREWKGFPDTIRMGSQKELCRVKDLNSIVFPHNGLWTTDSIELVRDKAFFKMRYFDIFCSGKYAIYLCKRNDLVVGYVILRKAEYKGLDMISLVDYRFYSRDDEPIAFKAASRLAVYNNIGFVITLSSRKYGLMLSPLTIKMWKQLNCAIGMKDLLEKFNDALFTSADSDLDFVYYK